MTKPFDQWKQVDLAWVAGLLEGEGCFYIRNLPRGNHYRIDCSMTDEDVLIRLRDILGVGKIYGPRKRGHYKPIWSYRLYNQQEVEKVLIALHPHMGIRRSQKIDMMLKGLAEEVPREWRYVRKGSPYGKPLVSNVLKTCTGCNETKPLDGFESDKNAADGHTTRCLVCRRAYFREWYAKSKVKV